MAKARVSVTENDETDAETQREAEEMASLNEATGGDLFSAVDQLRAAGATGIVCIVNRLTPVEKKGYCGQLSVSEFSLERMRLLYGAGRYMVQVKGPKGFLPGGSAVEIAETIEAPKGTSNEFSNYLEVMERREAERRAGLNDWIKIAVAGLAPVLAAWVSRSPTQGTDIAALVTALKPAPGPGLADLTTAMVNMKNMTAAPQQESKVDEILKIIETVQGFADKDDGGKGGSSWIDIVRDLIKAAPDAIKPMLEARMAAMQAQQAAQRGGMPPVQPAIQQPPQAASAPQVPKPQPLQQPINGKENDMLPMFMPVIKANLSKIAGWAEKNRDPEVYADVLVDELPDNFGAYIPLPQVLEYLNHEKWFEEICKIEPRLSSHHDWCNECRLAVIEIMKIFESESVNETGGSETPQSAMEQDASIVNTAEN